MCCRSGAASSAAGKDKTIISVNNDQCILSNTTNDYIGRKFCQLWVKIAMWSLGYSNWTRESAVELTHYTKRAVTAFDLTICHHHVEFVIAIGNSGGLYGLKLHL